jgi:hypothetical protein
LTRIAGPDKIILSWQSAAIGPDLFVLQRTEGSAFQQIETTDGPVTNLQVYVFDNVIAYFKQFTGDGKNPERPRREPDGAGSGSASVSNAA